MGFKAINESLLMDNNNTHASSSPAARQMHFLPDDSVQFRTVVQKAAKGIIVSLPCAEAPPSRGKKKKSALSHQLHHPGTVRMIEPMVVDEESEDNMLSTVLFHMQDIPTNIATWMKEGDELVFDVAREHLDNTYCIQSPSLTKLALPGRAEGTITVLKEGFGFISLAERQADVYFRLSDNVLPSCMQKCLLKDKDNNPVDTNIIAVGTEVSFDLSLACNNNKIKDNKENLKAHRILPLPKGSIITQKTIATKVKAVITQLHQDGSKSAGSGYLELDESVQGMTFEEHHPLIASMINSFITADNNTDNNIVYADIQSPHESRFIIAYAESKGLNVSFLSDTTTDDTTTHLRLKISKNNDAPSYSNDQNASPPDNATNNKKKKLKASKPVKLIRFDKKHAIYLNNNDDCNSAPTPLQGDIVTCDVIHSRRTQTYSAINLSLIERPTIINNASKSKQKSPQQHNCIGLILMEPSHSNISINHYSSSSTLSSPTTASSSSTTSGRWDNVTIDNHHSSSTTTINMNDGFILLLESKDETQETPILQHLVYHNDNHHDYHRSNSRNNNNNNHYHPKRGEFVSFHYNKGGKVKDIKLLKNYHSKESSSDVAKLIGTITNIDKEHQTATFQPDNNNNHHNNGNKLLLSPSYIISTGEVLGCDISTLAPTTQVEAMHYQNHIYGACRLSDLYLASSTNSKAQQQRPRLNLTVRKELGGKVVAQSAMAKGPTSYSGGNYGFTKGWTKRCSLFEVVLEKVDVNTANTTATTTTDNCDGSME